MTDNFDVNEHDAHAEGEHGEESKTQAWPDDQPPVDDFADPGVEETATASEETGMGAQEDVMGAEPRKSSALLPVIAGIGGLLCLGAVLYWQFGRSPSSSSIVPPPPPLQTAAASVTPVTAPAPQNMANAQAAASTDIAPKTSLAAMGSPSAALPTSATTTPTTAPSATGGTMAMEPAASMAPPTLLPPPTSNVVANNDAVETRLNNLSVRMDELKKEVEQATQQMSQMNMAMAPSSASGGAAIEDRLSKMEQQLNQLEHTASGAAAPPLTAASESAGATEAPAALAESRTSAHRVSRHKKPKAVVSSRKTARHAASAETHAGWVLRAATPDEAWLAKDASTSELRHVRVGDTLPGIGRVTAIRQDGDSWIVEGSAGSVR